MNPASTRMRALSLSSGICRLEGARTEARAGGVGARGAARGGPRGRAGKGAAAAEASAAQPGGLGSVPALPLAGQPREANYFLEPPLHHLVYKVVHKKASRRSPPGPPGCTICLAARLAQGHCQSRGCPVERRGPGIPSTSF